MSQQRGPEQSIYTTLPARNSSPTGYHFSSSYETASLKPTMDWLPTPGLPDWPAEDKPDEGYATSPLSSAGIYTPADSTNWNYFDESFKKAIEPSPFTSPLTSPSLGSFPDPAFSQVLAPTVWNPTWSNDGLPSITADHAFVPLSLVQKTPMAVEFDEDGEDTESPTNNCNPGSGGANNNTTRNVRKLSNHSRRCSASAKVGRYSTRNKEKETQVSHKRRDSTSSITTKHQLRSTKPGHRINYAEKVEPTVLEGTKGARTSHNLVEKQYRTRLNGQFSTLLGCLPAEVVGAEIEGFGRTEAGGAEKRVSKAEVLVLAKKHIQDLERDKKKLEKDRRALLEDVQRLKGAWVKMGGEIMP